MDQRITMGQVAEKKKNDPKDEQKLKQLLGLNQQPTIGLHCNHQCI